MTAGFAFSFPVTVNRPVAPRDRWGDEATPSAPHTVDGCSVYPRGSTELVDARDTVVDSVVLLAPYGADILPTDEVGFPDDDMVPQPYRGTTWKVDGSGSPWKSPFTGWEPGTEFVLRKEQG